MSMGAGGGSGWTARHFCCIADIPILLCLLTLSGLTTNVASGAVSFTIFSSSAALRQRRQQGVGRLGGQRRLPWLHWHMLVATNTSLIVVQTQATRHSPPLEYASALARLNHNGARGRVGDRGGGGGRRLGFFASRGRLGRCSLALGSHVAASVNRCGFERRGGCGEACQRQAGGSGSGGRKQDGARRHALQPTDVPVGCVAAWLGCLHL